MASLSVSARAALVQSASLRRPLGQGQGRRPRLPPRQQLAPRRLRALRENETEFEEEFEEDPRLQQKEAPPALLEAEILDDEGHGDDGSGSGAGELVSTTFDNGDALDISSAADLAVGGPGAGKVRDEVSNLLHGQAKYTDLHKSGEDKAGETKGAGSEADIPEVKMGFDAQEATDIVIESYEVLDSEVAEAISNVAFTAPATTEGGVHLPEAEESQEVGAVAAPAEESQLMEEVLEERESALTLKQVLAFSIPALAGIMTDPLMSFIDTACVGRMSSTELAAMGPNTAIYNFVLQIFTCFIVYTCGQVSKLSSKGQHDKVFRLVSHALILGVATGIFVAAGLIVFGNPLLAAMDTLPELIAPAASYLKIRAVSLPAVLVCMVSGAFCLGRKDSTTPLLVAIASTITNLLGDMVLIFGPPKLGIAGAALATTASVYVGAAYFLWTVSRQIPLKFLVPGWKDIKPFLTTSSMLTIRNCSIMVNYVAMTMVVGSYGTIASASHQVAISIFMIGNLAAEPFSQCAQSFLASIGSMKKRSLDEHRYMVRAMKLLVATTFVCGAAMFALTAGLCSVPSLFTTNPAIAQKVGFAAPIVGIAVWLSCVNCVSDGFIFANQDYTYGALLAVLNVPLLLFILNVGKNMGFGWWSVWIGMGAFYAIRLAENTARVLYLNKKRLHKAKTA